MAKSVPAQYFVDLYKRDPDPWDFERSEYERGKYAATLAALPRERYENALEIACSIGVFTSLLGERCERLLAVDVSEDALQRARRRCALQPQIRFERREMPRGFPAGAYDLITICEMGFYLCREDLIQLRDRVVEHCVTGAHVVLVHWTPPVNGHASSAHDVHGLFLQTPQLRPLQGSEAETYRLDVLERR